MENIIKQEQIVLYQIDGTNVSVSVIYKDDTFWLNQKAMAELFDVNVPAISKHLANIYEEGELDRDSTISKMEIVQEEGNRKVKRIQDFYNLDAIIAVGYRVNSFKATRFRQWATKTLKEYITKGFVLNDDMLKNGKPFGKDYFKELLERVRSIRASERRFNDDPLPKADLALFVASLSHFGQFNLSPYHIKKESFRSLLPIILSLSLTIFCTDIISD